MENEIKEVLIKIADLLEKENTNNIEAKENGNELTTLERYKLLIAAGNFNYDNYSKWMTYFSVATGAIFVGYCTFLKEVKEADTSITFLLLIGGYITSLIWYLSSKGYYFGNVNLISLINQCEDDLVNPDSTKEHRVYSVFYGKHRENEYLAPHRGANISTSKLTIFLSYLIAVFWCVLVLKQLINNDKKYFLSDYKLYWLLLIIMISMFLTIVISGIIGYWLKSDLAFLTDVYKGKIKHHELFKIIRNLKEEEKLVRENELKDYDDKIKGLVKDIDKDSDLYKEIETLCKKNKFDLPDRN